MIEAAYKDKPDSLSLIFNAAQDARSNRNCYVGWSVGGLILFPPITFYTGYKAWESFGRLGKLGGQVSREVERARLRAPEPH